MYPCISLYAYIESHVHVHSQLAEGSMELGAHGCAINIFPQFVAALGQSSTSNMQQSFAQMRGCVVSAVGGGEGARWVVGMMQVLWLCCRALSCADARV